MTPRHVPPLLCGATAKQYTRGTHRVVNPAEFWRSTRPFLPLAGVTRMANITGLDRTGIPTYSAVRPGGVTLSVASGKGLTPDAAMVSAAMEAIELFSAETADLPLVRCSYADVSRTHVAPPLAALPLRKHALVHADVALDWMFGSDLLTRAEAAVPFDLVTLRPPADVASPFPQTSNGLASGAREVEAVLVALLEVIERDAVSCWKVEARTARRPMPKVRIETLNAMPLVNELLDRLCAARIESIIYDCTVDTRIPVYYVRLVDAERRFVGVFSGSGAHLDPEIALVRALTEAAQSRAVYAAGSRDDLLSHELAQAQAQDSRAVLTALTQQPGTVDAGAATSTATPTFESDIARVLVLMVDVGVEHAIVVNLTPACFRNDLSVVRAVVPGLLGPGVEPGWPSTRAKTMARRVAP